MKMVNTTMIRRLSIELRNNNMRKLVITEEEKKHIMSLYEQPLGPLMSLGSRTTATPRFDLAKGATKTSEFSGRAPKVQDDPFDFYSNCYIGNIKKLVKHCKDNEYKFKPDSESKKLSIELYDNMNGISFGGAMSTLKKIKDESQFCKVSNGYRYDPYESGDLGQWIEDEVSLDPRIVWDILKKFSSKFGIWDLCDKRDHS